MNTQFTVCSYNLGSLNDYYQPCNYHFQSSLPLTNTPKSSLTFNTREENNAFEEGYKKAEIETSHLLEGAAEVYCLQEVGGINRPILNFLQDRNLFDMIHFKSRYDDFDTAIALNKTRFKNIENHSIEMTISEVNMGLTTKFKKDAAIATAIDIQTGQRVAFVSAHAPGFDYMKNPVDANETAPGDLYCREIAKKLAKLGSFAIQVIGADMNASPEKWQPRFTTLSKEGFQTHRTNESTNVNTRDAIDQKREIDFIFTKTTLSFFEKVKSIFSQTFKNVSALKINDLIKWDIKKNASDHLPVFTSVQSQITQSKVRQLCNWIFSIFKSN